LEIVAAIFWHSGAMDRVAATQSCAGWSAEFTGWGRASRSSARLRKSAQVRAELASYCSNRRSTQWRFFVEDFCRAVWGWGALAVRGAGQCRIAWRRDASSWPELVIASGLRESSASLIYDPKQDNPAFLECGGLTPLLPRSAYLTFARNERA